MTAASRTALWAAVIVLAAVAGFFAYDLIGRAPGGRETQTPVPAVRPESPGMPDTETADAEPGIGDTDEAAATADSGAGRTVPDRLPDFTLTDSHGKPRRLSDWPDRPLIVNFWATWCEPCRREIPLLKRLREKHASDGFEVVGIAVDFRDAVLEYAREIGMSYPILIGEEDGLAAIQAFGMQPVFPFTVFSDRRARIVAIKVGELHEDEAEFILACVKDIDGGRLTLPDAKQRIADELRELAVQRAKRNAAPQ